MLDPSALSLDDVDSAASATTERATPRHAGATDAANELIDGFRSRVREQLEGSDVVSQDAFRETSLGMPRVDPNGQNGGSRSYVPRDERKLAGLDHDAPGPDIGLTQPISFDASQLEERGPNSASPIQPLPEAGKADRRRRGVLGMRRHDTIPDTPDDEHRRAEDDAIDRPATTPFERPGSRARAERNPSRNRRGRQRSEDDKVKRRVKRPGSGWVVRAPDEPGLDRPTRPVPAQGTRHAWLPEAGKRRPRRPFAAPPNARRDPIDELAAVIPNPHTHPEEEEEPTRLQLRRDPRRDEEPSFISDIQPLPSDGAATQTDDETDSDELRVDSTIPDVPDDLLPGASRHSPHDLVTVDTAIDSDLLDAASEDDDDATRHYSDVQAVLEEGRRLAAQTSPDATELGRSDHDAPDAREDVSTVVSSVVDEDSADTDALASDASTRVYDSAEVRALRENAGNRTPPPPAEPEPPAVDADVTSATEDAAGEDVGEPSAVGKSSADALPEVLEIEPIDLDEPDDHAADATPERDLDNTETTESDGDQHALEDEPFHVRLGDLEIERPHDVYPSRSRGNGFVWFALMITLAIALGLLVWWLTRAEAAGEPMPATADGASASRTQSMPPPEASPSLPSADAVAAAIGDARDHVSEATAFEHDAASQRYEQAIALATRGDLDAAATVFDEMYALAGGSFVDARHAESYAALQMRRGEFESAREILWQARELFPRNGDLVAALQRAFDTDPRFLPEVETLGPDHIDKIKYLGGGSTITLRFLKGSGPPIAAFKPDQTRRQSNYRAEIAAWRLCELLRCAFSVPYNRPVRLSREDFSMLYARIGTGRQLNYATNFVDLVWEEIGEHEYLYGTEKEWVRHFTQFPIEQTTVWSPWLSQHTEPEELEAPLKRTLATWLDSEHTEKHYRRVLSEANGLTTRGLARQISDMLIFDYLVGNWDRFSTVQAWWGTNCQFSDGELVSIDNGAAFPLVHNSRVSKRFHLAERFSRSLILELRLLDKERTLQRLFPDPNHRERRAFETFWEKRAEVLGRVDRLIERYGEDAVLAFE